MAYTIQFNFTGTWETVEGIITNFTLAETLHKGLKAVDTNCSFSIVPDATTYNKLRGITTNDVAIKVLKDGNPFFYGYVRKNFQIKKTQKLEALRIEAVSPSFRLKRKVGKNLSYSNITVTQLLTNLLIEAGITDYQLPVISSTIYGFNVIAGEGDTYYSYIEKILYEYGYILDFDNTGKFITYKIRPDSLTTTKVFNGSNCLKEIQQNKREEEVELVEVLYKSVKSLSDQIVFSDTTGAKSGYKCYIEVPANSYLGGEEEWYAELYHPDGEIIYTSGLSLDWRKGTLTTLDKFEPSGNRVLISVKNNNYITSEYIRRFDIKATTCVVKVADGKVYGAESQTETEKIGKIETDYIYNITDAQYLADTLRWYYKYSDYQYVITSKTNYSINDIVTITESGIGVIKARIIEKRTNIQDGIYQYTLEGIDEYQTGVVATEKRVASARFSREAASIMDVTDLALNEDGTVAQPVDSNKFQSDITPSGDGLYLTKSYIGLRKDGNWNSYIKNDGGFKFYGDSNNYIDWDGNQLKVRGDLQVSGDVDLNGTVKVGDAIKSANYNAGLTGWQINGNGDGEFNDVIVRGTLISNNTSEIQGTIKTGAIKSHNYEMGVSGFSINSGGNAEFNNAIVRGAIYASAGIFGGTTIADLSIYQGDGIYNDSNTPFYLDDTGKFSLKDKLYFDGTDLNLTGNINATGGKIGGDTNGWQISTGEITAIGTGKIRTSSTTTRTELDSTGLRAYNAGTERAKIANDGSGFLGASNIISWTNTGVVNVGGFSVNSTTISNNNLSLVNTGNITAGTGNDVVVISASDATNRLWIGNSTASSAPFRVTKAGVLSATGANISGTISATTGSVGGWLINTNNLSSASSGSRIELSKLKSRISIYDSISERVAMGFLEGLPKPNTSPVEYYSASDYGYWIAPGDAISFAGDVKFDGDSVVVKNGGMSLTRVVSGTEKEYLYVGVKDSRTGIFSGTYDSGYNGVEFTDAAGNDGLRLIHRRKVSGVLVQGSVYFKVLPVSYNSQWWGVPVINNSEKLNITGGILVGSDGTYPSAESSLYAIKTSGKIIVGGDIDATGQLSTAVIKSSATANTAGTYYTGTTNPTGTTRLNYSGYLYATQLYDNGTRVSTLTLGTGSGNAYRGDYGNTAYTHSQATTGSIHGSTTVGGNLLRLNNPSAITFLKINADNTITTRSAAEFRADIGAGTSNLALGTTSTTAYRGDYGNTAYTHSQATTGSVHGSTTVGGNLLRLTNPSAITFIRVNADNTITTRSAAEFRSDIGAGTSNLALGTTSTTAYRGDYGNTAYTHSQSAHLALGTTSATAMKGDKVIVSTSSPSGGVDGDVWIKV